MLFLALSFIFVILFFYFHSYFYLILVLFCLFALYKRNSKGIFIISNIILFSFCIFRFNYFTFSHAGNFSDEFVVREDNNGYVILENNGNKVLFYDDNTLSKGNKIRVNGDLIRLDNSSEFNEYLNKQKVFYFLDGEVRENDNNLAFEVKVINHLLKGKDEENSKILRLILFNIKDETNMEFYRLFEEFSLSFLIVISGFHVNLLFKLLKKFGLGKYLFICGYLLLLNLSVSSLKAFIYYVLKRINKKLDLSFNNMDLLSLILISFLFINPSYCFNLGFIYTFVFSFSIDLINNTISSRGIKSKVLTKTIIFMISVPLVLISNFEINIASFVMTIFFEWPISILFIFSLLYLFFDKFYLLYKLYIFVMEIVLSGIDRISINLIFGKPSSIIVIFLYLSLFLLLYFHQSKMKKAAIISFFSYFLLLSFQYCLPIIDSREMVYFIDVGQGDCIALKLPNSKSVVLIDTGGNKNRDVGQKDIIPFLKEKGINCIDNIIISHDDYDHNGAIESLKRNFKVENIVENSSFSSIMIGDKEFKNLNINDSRDNDGSVVLYGMWGEINYLFTGDISSEIEESIISKNDLRVDVLKVSHHGSKDSTSEEFVKRIKPKIALIGVGKNNRYHHPHEETLEILSDFGVEIYRTDMCGNIVIYKSIFTNSLIIEKEKDMV